MTGIFLRFALLAGVASTVAGYLASWLLRGAWPLVRGSAQMEGFLWAVFLGVGLLGASFSVDRLVSPLRSLEEKIVPRCVVAATIVWVPYALLVSVCAPQTFGFPEFSFFLAPLAALGGTGLLVHWATDEVLPVHQERQEERLNPGKIFWIFITADIYWFFSRALLLLLLVAAFFLAAVVVFLTGFLQPDILSEGNVLLAIEFVAGLLLGGGVLGYSVRRLWKRVHVMCRAEARGE
ncbi:MAG TPA: hypothetical protein GXX19_11370 [Syntrophomonadaceae bacterium]|nr:hypothetical protein [Syntrophomonadaceae bacterium]